MKISIENWRIRFDRNKNDKVDIISDLIENPPNCQNLRWPPSRWSWSSCAWPMLCWWNLIQRRQDWITVMLAMKICWIWNNFLTLELAIFHNCYLIHSIINWLQVRSKYLMCIFFLFFTFVSLLCCYVNGFKIWILKYLDLFVHGI